MKTRPFSSVVFSLFVTVIVAVQANAEEPSNTDGPTLFPNPFEITDAIQYFTFGLPIEKCAAIDGCCKEASAAVACSAACEANCKVAKKAGCENCQFCATCGFSKPKVSHNMKLHDQLVKALKENAYLKARAEAQSELAAQKEAFLHELIEAKVEVASLQAHLEIAQHHGQIAQVHRVHLPQPPAQHHPVVAQLKTENERLKANIAALEQRLQELATRAAHKAAAKGGTKR